MIDIHYIVKIGTKHWGPFTDASKASSWAVDNSMHGYELIPVYSTNLDPEEVY